jgi:DNA-directed RNA polymerase subunit M
MFLSYEGWKMVSFCPKCGALMMPKKDGSSVVLSCSRCGYQEKGESETESYVLHENVEHTPRDKITIIEKNEKNVNPMPTTKVDCPNCHHNKAVYWQLQTRAADEGSTLFFRCLKCGHTWREY